MTIALTLSLVGLVLVIGGAATILALGSDKRPSAAPRPPLEHPDHAGLQAHADDAIALTAAHSQLFTDAEVAELRRVAQMQAVTTSAPLSTTRSTAVDSDESCPAATGDHDPEIDPDCAAAPTPTQPTEH